jgi:hypothetical protein
MAFALKRMSVLNTETYLVRMSKLLSSSKSRPLFVLVDTFQEEWIETKMITVIMTHLELNSEIR